MSKLNTRMLDLVSARMNESVIANLHDSKQITPTLFRVIATLSTEKVDGTKIAHAISAALDNNMSAVAGSFRSIGHAGVPAVVGYMRANRESVPFTEEAASKMKVVATNILMSNEDDSLWEVRSSGDAKYLVRQRSDDLGQLVQMARVRAYNVPKLSHLVVSSFGKMEYVAYVCAKTEELKHGFVLGMKECAEDEDDKLVVYSEDKVEEEIDPDQVIESAFVGESLKVIAAEKGWDLPANLNSKQGMLDYYGKMFDYAPDYKAQLDDIISDHSVA